MAFCPVCGNKIVPGTTVCEKCGTTFSEADIEAMAAGDEAASYSYRSIEAMYDHTSEFDPGDISDNKCFALLPYLLGALGIIITALISISSPYAKFHLRQAVKFLVTKTLIVICSLALIWTVIVPIGGVILLFVIFILKIVTVVQIFSGKACEPAIIRSIGILR
ncbi:MAG: zinc ribbon domain-containing protein [Lachnospiraceae bacterium]|nr:zinc ribbon domain-containing protein [Lachnospiraceae bacterium]